ncbi:MAG: excinuclease ABC subunit UvrC [Cellvibrionales bacterium]|nr:excinuclease ABC subunit UvrC [Cellvibrionales bacterium]
MTSSSFDSDAFLKQLTERPGIYQMFGEADKLLYIGKAKNLKKRVSSYFGKSGLSLKTQNLVKKIKRIDVTVTTTETEALLLEHNLIKEYRPPFNILLRDDKSYPYIFLSEGKYPRLAFHRGAKREKGTYFGPFPSGLAVRESLNLLQQVFKVRQCDESFFKNRSRACLQYQIKRCTGPCMEYVSTDDYAQQVEYTRLFLEGKNTELLKDLAKKMEDASHALEFEKAAEYRDQIQHLNKVIESQFIESGSDKLDVISLSMKAGIACVHVLFIRQGRMIGSRSYYPKLGIEGDEREVLLGFLGQFYLASNHRDYPSRIVVPVEDEELMALSEAFSQAANKKVSVIGPKRGRVDNWLTLAKQTADENISQRLMDKESMLSRFQALEKILKIDRIARMECFDISHSSGESTVASCVVFDRNGPKKSDYRRFNIEGITKGDDYAAMRQAIERRYKRLVKEESKLPDVLFIDGGKGQVTQAREILTELSVQGVALVGVAKGIDRRAGFEQLIIDETHSSINLKSDSEALHLIQHIRDEAHRFAVKSHTQSRDKKRSQSQLDSIPGIGAKRRKLLLHHFGSVKAITEAPVRELMKVPMISEKIAEDIYAEFHKP